MRNFITLSFILLAACDDPRTSIARYREALPSHDRPDATVAPVPQAGCTPRDANDRDVCSKSCGTFTRDLGCGVVHTYDCPHACSLVETCDETKHVCCVDISRRIDSFCRFFPYYSSSPAGAGATPARESNTRIPSPEEVGFLYCSYPGFVNCAKYWDGGTFVPAR